MHDLVTNSITFGCAFNNFANGTAGHRLINLKTRDIRLHRRHPAAHIGVDRQIGVAHADLVGPEVLMRQICERDIVEGRQTIGS